MLIQKVLGRWIALIKQNVGTTKKSYITASNLESCLKQAFDELREDIKKSTGEDIIPELRDQDKEEEKEEKNPLLGEKGAEIAATLKEIFDAGIEEDEKVDISETEEAIRLSQENNKTKTLLDQAMLDTIQMLKNSNISPEEKILKITETKEILLKEKDRVIQREQRIKEIMDKQLRKKEQGASLHTKGSLKELLEALDDDDTEISAKVIKIDSKNAKDLLRKLKEKGQLNDLDI